MLDLGHGFRRQMCLQEGAHVKPLPPAIQNQAAEFAARFLPAITESQLVAEAAATGKDIVVVFVQHDRLFFRADNLLRPPVRTEVEHM